MASTEKLLPMASILIDSGIAAGVVSGGVVSAGVVSAGVVSAGVVSAGVVSAGAGVVVSAGVVTESPDPESQAQTNAPSSMTAAKSKQSFFMVVSFLVFKNQFRSYCPE